MGKQVIDRRTFLKGLGISLLGLGAVGTGAASKYFEQDVEDIQENSNKTASYVEQAINSEYSPETETNKYNFDELRSVNPNVIAVIEGSCFDGGYLPIVSTYSQEEGEYYLNHSYDGTESNLGTAFVDYNNEINDQVIRIWAHNMHTDNGVMFTKLAEICQDQTLYDETLKQDGSLKIYTEDSEYSLDVVGCVVDDPREQILGTYDNQDEFIDEFNNEIKVESVISTDTMVSENDKVFTLTTCTDAGSWNDPYNRISVYCKATKQKTFNTGKTL